MSHASPHNPLAAMSSNGIWNEASIPVTEWEVPEHRVVIPQDLQRALRLDVPVARWSRAKRLLVERQHTQPVEIEQRTDISKRLALGESGFAAGENRYVACVLSGARTMVTSSIGTRLFWEHQFHHNVPTFNRQYTSEHDRAWTVHTQSKAKVIGRDP